MIVLDSAVFSNAERDALITELTSEMLAAAEALEFERAAGLRDRIKELQKKLCQNDGGRAVGNESDDS